MRRSDRRRSRSPNQRDQRGGDRGGGGGERERDRDHRGGDRRRRRSRSRSRSPYDDRRGSSSDQQHSRNNNNHNSDRRRFGQPPPSVAEMNAASSSSSNQASSSSATATLSDIFALDNKEAVEAKLEEETRKRKERIERWRAERKRQEEIDNIMLRGQELERAKAAGQAAPPRSMPTGSMRKQKWNLEDDAEDEDQTPTTPVDEAPAAANGAGEAMDTETKTITNGPPAIIKEEEAPPENDEDPLDAYMQEVNKEVRTLLTNKRNASSKGKIVIVTKTASGSTTTSSSSTTDKPTTSSQKNRGDVIEQNADAIEYSDEEREKEEDNIEQLALTSLAQRSKQLASVDHSKIYYRPFRKEFYVEVPELAKMSQEEVDAYREQLEGIRARGKNCPKPIKNWAQSGCSRLILELMKKYGYEKPTPIQAQAIPAILSGRDVIGIAKTGSGKTLAFLIPVFRHIADQPPLDELDGPICLIITPTRELAMQIAKESKKFTRPLNLRTVCVYGGTGISEQIAELKRGAEIIVATPGRLIDMLAANNGKVTNLRRVTYLVLDEADRMFDMGFEPQITKLLGNIRPDRQTVMFSATFPRQMEALARKALQKPIEIQVGGRSVVCKDIEQHALVIDEDKKFLKLLELIGLFYDRGQVLVFVDKQEHADELVGNLMKAGYNCAPLHGGIDQYDRDSTINDFKNGKIKLLIATSVAARGLDVKNLILVINYDCPNHYEDYVHRVGRTGRAGNKGYAYTFILPLGQERNAGDIVRAFDLAGSPVPDDLKELWDEYKTRMAAEGKQVKHGGGYGGHGYRFDEAEAEAVASKRKMEKLVMGMAGSDDEDEDEIDQQIEQMMKSTKRVTEGVNAVFQPPPASSSSGGGGSSTSADGSTNAAAAAPVPANVAALEKAKLLARQINLQRNIGIGAKDATQQTAEAVLKGGLAQPINMSARSVAEQLAQRLNEKLNYIPAEQAPAEEQPQQPYKYTRYEEELEINDFPQQVRWKVTSRETLGLVQDYAEVGISVKGTFIQPGKEPKEGERKLFLALEATSELAVSRAKAEIMRVLKEELRRLASQAAGQHVNKSRYKVM